MSLKVIGVGFGRTGTHSLKLALEQLGFSKCYHMEDLIVDAPYNVDHWQKAKDGEDVDWDSFFQDYRAACDFPAIVHYERYLELYPEAKFILTMRDPEKWYKSFGDTIIKQSKPSVGQIMALSFRMIYSKLARQRLKVFKFSGEYLKEWFPNGFEDKAAAIQFFEEWNQKVKDTIPADKLLICEIKEGWQPICDFLGVPVPQTEFPRSNSTAEFNSRKL